MTTVSLLLLVLRQVLLTLIAILIVSANDGVLERRLPLNVPRHLLEERTSIGVLSARTTSATTVEVPQTAVNHNNNILPSLRRHNDKFEAVQRHVLQRTIEAVANTNVTATTINSTTSNLTSSSSFQRSSSIQRVCSPESNGVVFPDDDFNNQLFRNDAEPICSCYKRDNTDLVLLTLVNDNSANVTEYLHKLNKAFSRIVGVIQYECSNTCEHCFTSTGASTDSTTKNESDTFCGTLQTNENSTYRGTEGNFSMEEYSTGLVTAASWERLFSESSFSISTCIEYTTNEVGTLCYGSSFQNLSTTPTCYVQYNDTMCQSCTFPSNPIYDVNVTNNDCFIVDCTNIIPNTSVINTCAGTGYNGIFRFLELIENGVSNTTTSVTVGSCDGPPTNVPIAAPISVQQASPSSFVPAPTTTTISSSRITLTVTTIFAPFTVVAWFLIIDVK